MTVLTRPEDKPVTTTTLADAAAPQMPKMTVRLSNALITNAPMSKIEIHAVRLHFLSLSALLDVSGPTFASMRRQAIDMHNRAVRRLNDVVDWEKRQATFEDDGKLLEIER